MDSFLSKGYLHEIKYKLSHPGFELGSTSPFSATVAIIPSVAPLCPRERNESTSTTSGMCCLGKVTILGAGKMEFKLGGVGLVTLSIKKNKLLALETKAPSLIAVRNTLILSMVFQQS